MYLSRVQCLGLVGTEGVYYTEFYRHYLPVFPTKTRKFRVLGQASYFTERQRNVSRESGNQCGLL